MGRLAGSPGFVSLANQPSFSTRPTLRRSLSIELAPTAVLMSVGHSEQSITTSAEMTKALGKSGSAPVIIAEMTIVTIGSQARGLTAFQICQNGLTAAFNKSTRPAPRPN